MIQPDKDEKVVLESSKSEVRTPDSVEVNQSVPPKKKGNRMLNRFQVGWGVKQLALGWLAVGAFWGCQPRGVVRDIETQQPIEGAKIIYPARDGRCAEIHTNDDGEYVIDNIVSSKSARAVIMADGYMALADPNLRGGDYELTPLPPGVRDTDQDGLADTEENLFQTNPLEPDTDGDGLLDGWEIRGVPAQGADGIALNLYCRGASPLRQDIFVEADWMEDGEHSEAPLPMAISDVVRVFESAPSANPDGSNGISIHVDFGRRPNDGGNAVEFQEWTTWEEFQRIKQDNFVPEREGIYHYTLFSHRVVEAPNYTGFAEIGGDDFLLGINGPLEAFGIPRIMLLVQWLQRGAFLHELGHNLGLRHGGSDDVNFKPNYVSIMNYRHRLDTFDYSREELDTLDETALDESIGIGGGPIDWNKNGQIDPDFVQADIDYLNPLLQYLCDCGRPNGEYRELKGHNDWANLELNFRDSRHGVSIASCETILDPLEWLE